MQLSAPRISRLAPNNSFKPNLFRYGKSAARKACHAFSFTAQVGLIQALGLLTLCFLYSHF